MTSSVPIWRTVLGGAGFGLLWGIVARLWMRFISTNPEFSVEGTAYILIVATLFGAVTGVALTARYRAWSGWRQYVPRTLVVIFFIPFGIAGGLPLMLTLLVFTLALTQHPMIGLWVVAGLALLLRMGTDIGIPLFVVGILLVSAITLTVWTWLTRNCRADGSRFVNGWRERLTRAFLILLALAGVGFVAWDIVSNHPLAFAVMYLLFYLVLLYPLFWGLRVGLAPKIEK